jgi:hypothetical protein
MLCEGIHVLMMGITHKLGLFVHIFTMDSAHQSHLIGYVVFSAAELLIHYEIIFALMALNDSGRLPCSVPSGCYCATDASITCSIRFCSSTVPYP